MMINNLELEPNPAKNILAEAIDKQIAKKGPMPFDEFMGDCLFGIETENDFISGYYTGGNVTIDRPSLELDPHLSLEERMRAFVQFYKGVDFTTTPEATPLFGFLLAREILKVRETLGKPRNFRIVELGAGNGTLGKDILEGVKYFDQEALRTAHYVIVDFSRTLIERQKKTLSGFPVDFIEGSAENLCSQK